MSKFILILYSLFFIACNSSISESTNDKDYTYNLNIPSNIDSNSIKLYSIDGTLNTTMKVIGTYHSEFDISSGYSFKVNAANIFLNASASDIFYTAETGDIFMNTPKGFVFVNGLEIDNTGIIKASNYKSSTGSIGKTYTEEFEDKQGNIRTRVYENGLLVSYKINGVEQ